MENIKTCELCREQIIKTEFFENLNCDEAQNLNILKNLEITVSRNANICSNCVNVSHLTYNFKTSCLTNNDHLKTLIRRSINDKLILEEVVVKEAKSEFKYEEKVCRFCLNFSEVNSLMEVNLEQNAVIKVMLERCLPEIDTNIVQNPLICYICSELLEKLFDFISQCKQTQVLDIRTDVIVSENTPTVVNHDDNIDNSFVNEENCEDIKNPELQIKSEDFDIDEDINELINHSNRLLKEGEIHIKPSSFPSGGTHQEIHWRTSKSKISKFFKCSECLFQFTCQSSLITHKKNNKEAYKCNKCIFTANTKCEIVKHKRKIHNFKRGLSNVGNLTFSCNLCPYQTDQRSNIKRHYRVHQNLTEVELFKCPKCSYVTKWKNSLVNHKVTHQDPSEVKMYKCMECSYETKHKSALQKHEKMHAENRQKAGKIEEILSNPVEEKDVNPKPLDIIDEKKFVCDICSYQTTKNSNLKRHCLIHKEPSEVNVFKCDYCAFATKLKYSLTAHTRRHKNPSDLPKFKCNDCPLETKTRSKLVSHALVHKDPSEVNMYKCKVCPFQTKYKRSILPHEKTHQVEIYRCDECIYKTKVKRSFMLHLQYHKEWRQPAKSIQNLKRVNKCFYKCNECSYVVNQKSSLKIHQQALSRITLKRHYNKNHSDLEIPFGKLKTFRCNECDYKTTYYNRILKHMQAHNGKKLHQA